jgi:tRNA1Val (adenine37-N6)-methyltransferase
MKVGTDGVLLGAWASCENAQNILDIGTGTGLIALMLAQRSKANVKALEIDELAAIQAKENIANSSWKNRVEIVKDDFIDFSENTNKLFDLIVTNPPYFENALLSPIRERTIARHTQQLNYEAIIAGVSKLLSKIGIFSLIVPIEFEKKIEDLCFEQDMFLERICFVKPTPQKESKRVLMEFSRNKKPLTKSALIIETGKRHEYSQEYIELTKDFYLKF